MITSINTRCRLTDAGADLIVSYAAKVVGTTIERVRLLDNGKVVNDSNVINSNSYTEEYTIKTDAGSRHQLQMEIDSPASSPRNVTNIATCPVAAAPTGPRA